MNDNDSLATKDELYEHVSIKVDKGQEPLRVDKFIINRIESTSRNRIQLAAKNGFVFVNNKPVKSNYKVKPLDEVKIMLNSPLNAGIFIPIEEKQNDKTTTLLMPIRLND